MRLDASTGNTLQRNVFAGLEGGVAGGGQRTGGQPGPAVALHLSADALDNAVALDNRVGDDPLVYLSGAACTDVRDLVLDGPLAPTNLGKLVLRGCEGVEVSGNVVTGYAAGDGETRAPQDAGSTGATAVGIRLIGGADLVLDGNEVRGISGGRGGPHLTYEGNRCNGGGTGGLSRGIYVTDVAGLTSAHNVVHGISGGSPGASTGCGSRPGSAIAYQLGASTDVSSTGDLVHTVSGWGAQGIVSTDRSTASVFGATVHGLDRYEDDEPCSGVRAASGSTLDVSHTLVSAVEGAAVDRAGDAGVVRVAWSVFWSNGAPVAGEVEIGPGGIVAAPDGCYCAEAGGDFRLREGSPCVDAGPCPEDPENEACHLDLGYTGQRDEIERCPAR